MENNEHLGKNQTRTGAIVVAIALIIGIGPFLGKAYLRTTIPLLRSALVSDMRSESTTDFLLVQMDDLMKEIRSDGEQLTAHCPQSRAILLRHQHSMDVLNLIHSKYVQSVRATEKEQCQPYTYLAEMVKARESALRQAQDAHLIMMAIFTAIAGIFLLIVLRSQRVPDWAIRFTIMAFGAVVAGWFPI
jgi:hypothetical protein